MGKETEVISTPPTERQVAYANKLGIDLPRGVTFDEISDLISFAVEEDIPASDLHRSLAKSYGVTFTRYMGKGALFLRIRYIVSQPGRETDLCAWFVYRVYRCLTRGSDSAPVKSPNDPAIQAIASELAMDAKVLRSIRRYGREDSLIWFGTVHYRNGSYRDGASKDTIAFQHAAEVIRSRLRV